MQIKHVAILGGGFSGALQAVNLLRHEGPRATLIERRKTTARGVAYSAAHPDHLLNVRASNMSALPDDPGHFARWLEQHRPDIGATGFAPRLVYGDYLSGILEQTREASPARLSLLRDEAVDVNVREDAVEVILASGGRIGADAAILAVGNLPPHVPAGIDPAVLGPDRFAHDPWSANWEEGLTADDTVVVIGSGLTTVDIVLALEARGYQGKIVALSRRGLVPRIHEEVKLGTPLHDRPKPEAVGLLRHVRARAEAIGWRAAVDELRPFTQDLWVGAESEERNRFLRHLRPWWDVHRHRMAPSIAARLAKLQAEGRLQIIAGKLMSSAPTDMGVTVTYRPRGEDAPVTLAARRIINATGPQGDLRRSTDPLLSKLLERGLIRSDPMKIGIDVTAQSEVLDADGKPQSRLFALGPMTRGTFWEIVAVPDIRRQTWSVARKLSNAHWVGGEGL